MFWVVHTCDMRMYTILKQCPSYHAWYHTFAATFWNDIISGISFVYAAYIFWKYFGFFLPYRLFLSRKSQVLTAKECALPDECTLRVRSCSYFSSYNARHITSLVSTWLSAKCKSMNEWCRDSSRVAYSGLYVVCSRSGSWLTPVLIMADEAGGAAPIPTRIFYSRIAKTKSRHL